MVIFNAAQPALLYIVPAVLGAVALHAVAKNEFHEVCHRICLCPLAHLGPYE